MTASERTRPRWNPAGEIADAFEAGEVDATLTVDADREQLREFVAAAEAGEYDLRADPALEATVRIVRSLLDDGERS